MSKSKKQTKAIIILSVLISILIIIVISFLVYIIKKSNTNI